MLKLKTILQKSFNLSDESANLLIAAWSKTKHLEPKETLLQFDHQENNLYFICDGCVRLYILNVNGEETNLGFGYQNTFITSFQSFIDTEPSLLSIEALLPTELLCIDKLLFMKLVTESTEIAQMYRNMLEITLSGHIQRQIELLTLKPQQRYESFMRRSGHLINLIPLKQIASYLMMTPETLSRIRAKHS